MSGCWEESGNRGKGQTNHLHPLLKSREKEGDGGMVVCSVQPAQLFDALVEANELWSGE